MFLLTDYPTLTNAVLKQPCLKIFCGCGKAISPFQNGQIIGLHGETTKTDQQQKSRICLTVKVNISKCTLRAQWKLRWFKKTWLKWGLYLLGSMKIRLWSNGKRSSDWWEYLGKNRQVKCLLHNILWDQRYDLKLLQLVRFRFENITCPKKKVSWQPEATEVN